MCHDAKTSIGTFLFVGGISLFLWFRNQKIDRAIALIFLVISSMQLVEFVIWTHLGPTPENKVASSLIPILLYTQPLFIALIMWIFKAGHSTNSYLVYGLLALFPIFLWNISSSYTTVSSRGHLEWNHQYPSIYLTIYYSSMAYLFLTLKNSLLGLTLYGAYFGSWLYYKYYYNRDWSSMWCHAVNGAAVVALL
jgi:hypothetical protein